MFRVCFNSPVCPCSGCLVRYGDSNLNHPVSQRKHQSYEANIAKEKADKSQLQVRVAAPTPKSSFNCVANPSDVVVIQAKAPLAERVYPDCSQEELVLFNKIYAALSAGETSMLKRGNNERIQAAWSLVQKYFHEVKPDNHLSENIELFRDIYQHAFKMSGIFKRSSSFGQSLFAAKSVSNKLTALERATIHQHIDSAKPGSRTDKIKKCLNGLGC